jgi:glycosyltransferase involved in cell wall biosynthesis
MTERGYPVQYSIVICAYNPDQRILSRCLQAVAALNRKGLLTETILVDNNSNEPVRALEYVRAFENKIPGFRVIEVAEQGVKYARMAAIEQASGKYILYIDYDNEPVANYLEQLNILNTNHPEVAAWGPGDVTVDFIDGIDNKIESYARTAFQEKHLSENAFGNQRDWQSFYPVGTGLCSFSSILKDYVQEAKKGRFSLPGRKGNQLSSGEDTEMILLAISKGYSAGSSPDLKLNHLISRSRANTAYLNRMTFGTAACYDTCLLEVFPERKDEIQNKLISAPAFSRRAIKRFVSASFGKDVLKTFDFILWLGLVAASYYAMNKRLPGTIKWFINYLKLL